MSDVTRQVGTETVVFKDPRSPDWEKVIAIMQEERLLREDLYKALEQWEEGFLTKTDLLEVIVLRITESTKKDEENR